MPASMRAFVMKSVGHVGFVEKPRPEEPGPTGAIVRNNTTGLLALNTCCGTSFIYISNCAVTNNTTGADVNSGSIDHALRLVTPLNSPNYVAPATRSDGTHSGGIPEGQLMRLDPNLDLSTLGLNSFQLMVAKALQTYGAYNADSGGAFTLIAENPLSGAHYNTTPSTLPRTLIQHLQFLNPPPTATAGHIDSNTDPGCNQQH